MPCRAHSSVIVHSCDNHCFINSLRFFTTPLTFQGMLLCSRLRRTDQTVNHLPGLLCQLCPQSGPNAAHGVSRGTGNGKGTSPGGAEEYFHAKDDQSQM